MEKCTTKMAQFSSVNSKTVLQTAQAISFLMMPHIIMEICQIIKQKVTENISNKDFIIKGSLKIICFKALEKKKVNFVNLKENI